MQSVRVLKCSQQTKFCIRTMTKPRRSRGSAGKCRAGTKGTQHGSPGRLSAGGKTRLFWLAGQHAALVL